MLEYNRGPAASPRPGRETFVGEHDSAAAVAAAAGSGGRDGDGEEECLVPVMYRVGDTALLGWPREEPDEAVAVLRIYALYEVGKFSKKKRKKGFTWVPACGKGGFGMQNSRTCEYGRLVGLRPNVA
jgi:hypothetical protein